MKSQNELYDYTFGDVVMTATRHSNRHSITWYLNCPECQQMHMFRRLGPCYWIAQCEKYSVEWTVTPTELFVQREVDFSLIMGHST